MNSSNPSKQSNAIALYDLSVPQFIKVLGQISKILDKAQAFADLKKFDVGQLLHYRLSPDQFHFIRQVQITCDTAKFFCANLVGKEAPKFEDKEVTLADLKVRINKTIDYLHSVKPEQMSLENRKITPHWKQGFFLEGQEYVVELAIPNFYFHATTAYSILRHAGVEIGKNDFLGTLNFKPL